MSLETTIYFPVGATVLAGNLTEPEHARGLVIVADTRGDPQISARHRRMAHLLAAEGFSTVYCGLLSDREVEADELTCALHFAIDLLTERLIAVTEQLRARTRLAALPIGYFAADSTAAAAISAAGARPDLVRAIVALDGRPDLADKRLSASRTPALLLVTPGDELVLELNRIAADRMQAPAKVELIGGASANEVDRKLRRAAELAASWFGEWFLPNELVGVGADWPNDQA